MGKDGFQIPNSYLDVLRQQKLDDSKCQVLIVDNVKINRLTLRQALESDSRINVIADASSGEEGLVLAKEIRPHVIIFSEETPDMVTSAFIEEANTFYRGLIVLSIKELQPDKVLNAISAGALGYYHKRISVKDLNSNVLAVSQGNFGEAGSRVAEVLSNAGISLFSVLNDVAKYNDLTQKHQDTLNYIKNQSVIFAECLTHRKKILLELIKSQKYGCINSRLMAVSGMLKEPLPKIAERFKVIQEKFKATSYEEVLKNELIIYCSKSKKK